MINFHIPCYLMNFICEIRNLKYIELKLLYKFVKFQYRNSRISLFLSINIKCEYMGWRQNLLDNNTIFFLSLYSPWLDRISSICSRILMLYVTCIKRVVLS